MSKLLVIGIVIGLLLAGGLGAMVGMAISHKTITSCNVNEVIVEQDCSISDCQQIIQQAFYDVGKTKHCLVNSDNIECMI